MSTSNLHTVFAWINATAFIVFNMLDSVAFVWGQRLFYLENVIAYRANVQMCDRANVSNEPAKTSKDHAKLQITVLGVSNNIYW